MIATRLFIEAFSIAATADYLAWLRKTAQRHLAARPHLLHAWKSCSSPDPDLGTRVALWLRMIALHDDIAPSTTGLAHNHSTSRPAPLMSDTIRAEFLEMPCLTLTIHQAMRLWSLDERTCRSHLDALSREGFLRLTADGAYRRAAD